MRRWYVLTAMVLGAVGVLQAWEEPKSVTKVAVEVASAPLTKADQDKREAPIREVVAAFVKNYNAHDIKGLSELFLPEAQVVDADDNTIQGREAIASVFAGLFEQNPKAKIEVEIHSIRFIGSSLAVESGATKTTLTPGGSSEIGRYSVLHIQQGGKWSMGLVRDLPSEPSHRDHLQSLAWMEGDWIDESRAGVVKTSCRWADNNSFLLQEVSVHQAGRDVMKINQRIGWDPLTKRFKAWMFDDQGGHGESVWTPTESGWLIKATSVHSDGTTASATNSIEPTSMDRYIFRSADRVLGNEVLPPVEVSVVRQPPQPK